ncbi:MAG: DNA (cytosine-5-)-methyltransferase, partial [Planctomycetota bacterium]
GKRSMAELRTDSLAGCLRTPKGGSGRQILFEAGRGQYRVRLLNADECARLMGADGYRVTAPLNQALFGFGDAVCVDALAWVVEHRINPVAERIVSPQPATAS